MLVLTTLTSGCRLADLSFRTDKRVEFVAPENRSTVKPPFDVRWTVKDFTTVGRDGSASDDKGYFAVLIDQTPMPPGAGVDYFARDDDSCTPRTNCPDQTYLADRNIFLTQATTFRIDALSDTRPTDRPSAKDEHEVTVVLLNGKSERIGEGAFRLKVFVDRTGE